MFSAYGDSAREISVKSLIAASGFPQDWYTTTKTHFETE